MVSMVLRGTRRERRIERALAAKMTPRTGVSEAFGVAAPMRMRQARKAA
jgi:hypothetical protein